MFNFITRDHVFGTIFGAALIGALTFMTGCSEEDKDTADTAVTSTTTTETGTTTGTTTGTGTTTTGS